MIGYHIIFGGSKPRRITVLSWAGDKYNIPLLLVHYEDKEKEKAVLTHDIISPLHHRNNNNYTGSYINLRNIPRVTMAEMSANRQRYAL